MAPGGRAYSRPLDHVLETASQLSSSAQRSPTGGQPVSLVQAQPLPLRRKSAGSCPPPSCATDRAIAGRPLACRRASRPTARQGQAGSAASHRVAACCSSPAGPPQAGRRQAGSSSASGCAAPMPGYWPSLRLAGLTQSDGQPDWNTFILIPLWFLFLIVALPTAYLFYRDRKRIPPGHCSTCGYDLTGAEHERCPECGAKKAETRG